MQLITTSNKTKQKNHELREVGSGLNFLFQVTNLRKTILFVI